MKSCPTSKIEEQKKDIPEIQRARRHWEDWLIHVILIPVYIMQYSLKMFLSIIILALILSPPALMLLLGMFSYALVHEGPFSITGYIVLFGLLGISESFVFVIGILWIFEMLVPEFKSVWEQEE